MGVGAKRRPVQFYGINDSSPHTDRLTWFAPCFDWGPKVFDEFHLVKDYGPHSAHLSCSFGHWKDEILGIQLAPDNTANYLGKSTFPGTLPIVTGFPFSMSMWLRTDAVDDAQCTIIVKDNAGTPLKWGPYIAGFSSKWGTWEGSGNTNYSGSNTVTVGETAHFLQVYRSQSNKEIYKNGISIHTSTNTDDVWTGECSLIRLAIHPDLDSQWPFDGGMVDLRIYDKGFSDAEALDHYRTIWDLYQPHPFKAFIIGASVVEGVSATAAIATVDFTGLAAKVTVKAGIATADFRGLAAKVGVKAGIATADFLGLPATAALAITATAGISTADFTGLAARAHAKAGIATATFVGLAAKARVKAGISTADFLGLPATAALVAVPSATAAIATADFTGLAAKVRVKAGIATADFTGLPATAALGVGALAGIATVDFLGLAPKVGVKAGIATVDFIGLAPRVIVEAGIATADFSGLPATAQNVLTATAAIATVDYRGLAAKAGVKVGSLAVVNFTGLAAQAHAKAGIATVVFSGLSAKTVTLEVFITHDVFIPDEVNKDAFL
jgi:hypothetical protein